MWYKGSHIQKKINNFYKILKIQSAKITVTGTATTGLIGAILGFTFSVTIGLFALMMAFPILYYIKLTIKKKQNKKKNF